MNNDASTDTVPRLSRCPSCGALALRAWSGTASVTVGMAPLSPDAARLAYASGHAVYRVRSTRRPTLAPVLEEDDIIERRAYTLGHTCPEADALVES